MITSHESSMLLAEVLLICAKLGCDIRFVRSSSKGNGSMTLHGVSATYHKSITQAVAEHMQSNPVLAKLSHFTLEEDLPMVSTTDRREKIQAMLLERIEQVFAKYDETKGSDNAVGNANALECIAQALQAVGYPARDIIVGAYAAPARTDADNHCKPTCPCRKTVD